MPLYNTLSPPPALGTHYPLNQVTVFTKETVLTGQFSQQISIPLGMNIGSKGIRVEGDFNANPGTFEFDIMESDFDSGIAATGGQAYQQVPTSGSITTVTTGVNGASTHFGTDLIPFAGQFCLIYIKTQPTNATITVTIRITRAA